jgi:DNA-directed RNA polymerase subunit M/transcription elongation factor TFIIS
MEPNETASRTCPKCGSGDYQFRSRKKIEEPKAVETKYRCKPCGHEWRERLAKSE